MDKITIALDHADAEKLRDLLGELNYYQVGAILSKAEGVTDDDFYPTFKAVTHAHLAIVQALD